MSYYSTGIIVSFAGFCLELFASIYAHSDGTRGIRRAPANTNTTVNIITAIIVFESNEFTEPAEFP
jgi:hypothetical protein